MMKGTSKISEARPSQQYFRVLIPVDRISALIAPQYPSIATHHPRLPCSNTLTNRVLTLWPQIHSASIYRNRQRPAFLHMITVCLKVHLMAGGTVRTTIMVSDNLRQGHSHPTPEMATPLRIRRSTRLTSPTTLKMLEWVYQAYPPHLRLQAFRALAYLSVDWTISEITTIRVTRLTKTGFGRRLIPMRLDTIRTFRSPSET